MMSLSCTDVVGLIPPVRALLIINILVFGGGLALAILVICVRRAANMRSRARDPYARPFGDLPVNHLRAFGGAR